MSDKLNKKNKVEFTNVQEMQDIVMKFLVDSTVEGKLLFVADGDTIIALVNKDSIEKKNHLAMLGTIISKQMIEVERMEKLCKPLILPKGQQ